MKMTEEIFELLIGKYLDGEITPSEQRLLEMKLDSDPNASQLFEQFQQLHEKSSNVIASELLEKSKSPQEIFANALAKSKHSKHRIIKLTGWTRFALGAAAGLIIGIGLHFVLPLFSPAVNEQAPIDNTNNYVKRIDESMLFDTPSLDTHPPGQRIRNLLESPSSAFPLA